MGYLETVYGDDLLYVFAKEQCNSLDTSCLAIIRDNAEIKEVPGVTVMKYSEDFESMLNFPVFPKTRKPAIAMSLRQMHEMLDRVTYGVLSFNDGEMPYSVGLNYLRIENDLYFHGAMVGHKLEGLNKLCTLFVTEDFGPALKIGTHSFNSVIVHGKLVEVTDVELKKDILLGMVNKLAPVHPWNDQMPIRTTVMKLDTNYMTGKNHIY